MAQALRVLVLGLCVVVALSVPPIVQEVTALNELTASKLGEGEASVSVLRQDPDEGDIEQEEAEFASESDEIKAEPDPLEADQQDQTDPEAGKETPALADALAECQTNQIEGEQSVLQYQAEHEQCSTQLAEATLDITHSEKKAAAESLLRKQAETEIQRATEEKAKAEETSKQEEEKVIQVEQACNKTTAARVQANSAAIASTAGHSEQHRIEFAEQQAVLRVKNEEEKTLLSEKLAKEQADALKTAVERKELALKHLTGECDLKVKAARFDLGATECSAGSETEDALSDEAKTALKSMQEARAERDTAVQEAQAKRSEAVAEEEAIKKTIAPADEARSAAAAAREKAEQELAAFKGWATTELQKAKDVMLTATAAAQHATSSLHELAVSNATASTEAAVIQLIQLAQDPDEDFEPDEAAVEEAPAADPEGDFEPDEEMVESAAEQGPAADLEAPAAASSSDNEAALLECQHRLSEDEKSALTFHVNNELCSQKLAEAKVGAIQAQRKAAHDEDTRAKALLHTDAVLAAEKQAVWQASVATATREAAEQRCDQKVKVLADANGAAMADAESKTEAHESALQADAAKLTLQHTKASNELIAKAEQKKEASIQLVRDERAREKAHAEGECQAKIEKIGLEHARKHQNKEADNQVLLNLHEHDLDEHLRQIKAEQDEAVKLATDEHAAAEARAEHLTESFKTAEAAAAVALQAKEAAESNLAEYKTWADNQLAHAKAATEEVTSAAHAGTAKVQEVSVTRANGAGLKATQI